MHWPLAVWLECTFPKYICLLLESQYIHYNADTTIMHNVIECNKIKSIKIIKKKDNEI